MSRDFQPSEKSRTPAEHSIAQLRYLIKAAEAITARLEQDGEVPQWVQAKVQESTVALGMAVSYLRSEPPKPQKRK